MNYYNEFDATAAQWLRNLIEAGHIPNGYVDERSIQLVQPGDLAGFTQCHWFAGIGGWSLALKLAGWPEDRSVWTGSCPCFATGTLVLTENGYRPIEDLRIGDLVLTHKGRWRAVNAVMSRDNADLRRIRAQGVPDVITTDEHPFWVRSNRRSGHFGLKVWNEPRWRESGRIKCGEDGDYLSQVLPGTCGTDRTPAFWFIVGRYLADGWRVITESKNGSKHRVIICCAREEATWLAGAIARAGFKPSIHTERTVTKFSICDADFYGFLEQFGDKAHGKRIPRLAIELPVRECRALVDGYISGDGYREDTETNSGHRITTVSRALALGVALLAQRSHGVVASVRRCRMPRTTVIEGRSVNQRDFYVISIPDRNRSAFVDGDYGWKLARKSEPAGIGRVHNIGVEEDESYCAEGAIVHNCQPFSAAGKGKGTADPRHLWPDLYRLIRACRPDVCFGEQVSGAAGYGWLDGVRSDLAAEDYSLEALDIPAGAINAPHQRNRLYWVGTRRLSDTQHSQRGAQQPFNGNPHGRLGSGGLCRGAGGLSNAQRASREDRGTDGGLGVPVLPRLEGHAGNGDGGDESGRIASGPHGPVAAPGGDGGSCGLGDSNYTERRTNHANGDHANGDHANGREGYRHASASDFWSDFVLVGPDPKGKYRRVGRALPRLRELVARLPGGMGRMRASGEAEESESLAGWGTPRVTTNGGRPCPESTGRGSRLEDQCAELSGWNTPRASDGDGGVRQEDGKRSLGLNSQATVVGWTSPTAQDGNRGSLPPRPHDAGVPLSQQVALSALSVTPRDHIPLLECGRPGRIGALKGFGNAIVPQLAAVVIRAYMETE